MNAASCAYPSLVRWIPSVNIDASTSPDHGATCRLPRFSAAPRRALLNFSMLAGANAAAAASEDATSTHRVLSSAGIWSMILSIRVPASAGDDPAAALLFGGGIQDGPDDPFTRFLASGDVPAAEGFDSDLRSIDPCILVLAFDAFSGLEDGALAKADG